MRAVLLQLALTSNGAIASRDADSGGGSVRHYSDVIPELAAGDAPHLHYMRLWNQACEYEEAEAADEQGWYRPPFRREQVLAWAEKLIGNMRHSRADRTREETLEQLHARIVSDYRGVPKLEAARRLRTGVTTVVRARRGAGLDDEHGQDPLDLRGVSRDERRARVRELDEKGINAKQIAFTLGIPYVTVLRDLGRREN